MELSLSGILKFVATLFVGVVGWLASYFIHSKDEEASEAKEGRKKLHERIETLSKESRERDQALDEKISDLSQQMHTEFVREDRHVRKVESLEASVASLDEKVERNNLKTHERLDQIITLLSNNRSQS